MKITKPFTKKQFLDCKEIVWYTFDDYDPMSYTFRIYPKDESTTEVSTFTQHNYTKTSKTEEVDTDGILQQVNNAIQQGDEVIAIKKEMKGYKTKPMKKDAYKKMIGKLPKCTLKL